MLLQVHDELVFEVAPGEAKALEALVREQMAAAADLINSIDGDSDSPELAARLTAATSSHLRELATLPRTATDHFDARLARASSDN